MAIPLRSKDKRSFVYAGRRVKTGADFEARSTNDARLLKAIGRAEDRPPARPSQQYQTRVMTASDASSIPLTTKLDPAELESMNIDTLRALADSRGIKYHHFAGAARIRQFILDAQSE